MPANKKHRKPNIAKYTSLAAMVVIVIGSSSVQTASSFNQMSKSNITAKADSIKAPTNLKVKSLLGGQTELSWVPAATSYTTGYKILRSDNIYGPWSEVANIKGKTISSYTDTTSFGGQWIYRVESVWSNWVSTSPGFESPPAIGRDFFDAFNESTVIESLDGKLTADGSSVWQVWSGVIDSGKGWATGRSAIGVGDVAVVRTPTQDAKVFIADMDGVERFIVRGKDPKNYIYAGSAESSINGSTNWSGSFEIGIMKNGVATVLASKPIGSENQNFRLEVKGTEIKAIINANRDDPSRGSEYLTASTSFLLNDATATYFGFGFTRSPWGITDYTFNAF